MTIKSNVIFSLIFLVATTGFALEPDQILVIANSDVAASVQIAQYYCAKRGVPTANVLALPLGTTLSKAITRDNYEKQLAEPVRKKLSAREFAGRIKCLLTTYGVPIEIGKRGMLKSQESKLRRLKKIAEQKKKINRQLTQLQSQIDYIVGKETNASVDSELSMVLFDGYELYRWQPNKLMNRAPYWDFKTLMVCRLDGPGLQIAKGLVDKAISAERAGLKGVAYIDSQGRPDDKKPYSKGHFDQSLRDLAMLTDSQTQMPVVEEHTSALFAPGQCPFTAVYCGWYSLKKYVDAFDFVDGAIGYHISSLEAVNLRDPNSSQWCPAMLKDGITATLGAVAEPYLHSFPEPKAFFLELFNGRCLVEAYYQTKPFNSWQLVLIGDPLYRPFKRHQMLLDDDF